MKSKYLIALIILGLVSIGLGIAAHLTTNFPGDLRLAVAFQSLNNSVLTDIFKFEPTGIGEGGKIFGELKATGIRPQFSPRLEAAGFKLSGDIYGTSIGDMLTSRQRR